MVCRLRGGVSPVLQGPRFFSSSGNFRRPGRKGKRKCRKTSEYRLGQSRSEGQGKRVLTERLLRPRSMRPRTARMRLRKPPPELHPQKHPGSQCVEIKIRRSERQVVEDRRSTRSWESPSAERLEQA